MKQIKEYVILVFLLFFSINIFSQTEEHWIEIDPNIGVEGIWEGTAVSTIDGNFFGIDIVSKINVSIIYHYKNNDKNVISFVKYDFEEFLNDLLNNKLIAEQGYTIEKIWNIFRIFFENFGIISNYTISFEITDIAYDYFASDERGRFLINDRKDLLLLIYPENYFNLGVGDSGFKEMVFKKVGDINKIDAF